jgi:hypothetical protein
MNVKHCLSLSITGGVWEQDAEENIWTQDEQSDK